jgi:hypothetical protein
LKAMIVTGTSAHTSSAVPISADVSSEAVQQTDSATNTTGLTNHFLENMD